MSNDLSWMVTHSLLETLKPDLRHRAFVHLKPHDLETCKRAPACINFQTATTSIDQCIHTTHSSWLLPMIANLPQNDRLLYIASLSEIQKKQIIRSMEIQTSIPTITSYLRQFIHEEIFRQLTNKTIFLPKEFLPPNPLNLITELSRDQYLRLFDFLGIHDLALDTKKLIRAQILKQLSLVLTADELELFKKLKERKGEVSFQSMHLEKWNGNAQSLRKMLHVRGINRLAKALYGCHESLFWHVTHCLDRKRAETLEKLCTDLKNVKAQEKLIHDILQLIPKK